MENNRPYKVAYIHGRPEGHPIHTKIAQSIHADFYPVDFKLRWHDRTSFFLRRYLSWFVCAFTFPRKKQYDVFFSEDAYVPPVIMKRLKLLRSNQKIIALMASHTLYFLYTKRYSPSTNKLLITLLKNYDAIICIGVTQAKIAHELFGKDFKHKIYTIYNGVPNEKQQKLFSLSPKLNNYKIIFIGQILNQDRIWYKGLDIMLKAFSKAKLLLPELTFSIIGDCNKEMIQELIKINCADHIDSIFIEGETTDIYSHFESSSLYLHCARGDAFPTTVIESLAAGTPVLVSEWTGNKDIVAKINENLVAPLDENAIAEKITWYFNLTNADKLKLSSVGREIVGNYSEEKALANFKNTFYKICNDLNINDN